MKRSGFLWRGFTLLISLLFSTSSWALQTRVMNLEELESAAVDIVWVRVLSHHEIKKAGQFPAISTKVETVETLKGKHQKIFEIRQVARRGGDGQLRLLSGHHLWPTGSEILLFLSAESKSGFRRPIGFEQGVFQTLRKPTQKNLDAIPIVNGAFNQNLFHNTKSKASSRLSTRLQKSKTDKASPLTIGDLKAWLREVKK